MVIWVGCSGVEESRHRAGVTSAPLFTIRGWVWFWVRVSEDGCRGEVDVGCPVKVVTRRDQMGLDLLRGWLGRAGTPYPSGQS